MRKRIIFLGILLLVLISPIFSWSAHREMTELILKDYPWLGKYNKIKVTPYTYNDPSPYNPAYAIPYRGEKIGDTIDAITIITRYVIEPDNGMDDNINLNSMQKLTGGSSGWRHQYYIALGGALKLGEAPKRIIHFWNLAKEAFQKKDYYWGFRFFAYSLHYLQDLTQPFHAYPMPLGNVIKNIFNLDKVIAQGENHHYTLEDYQEYQILNQNPLYIDTLKKAKPYKIENPEEAGIKAAWTARNDAGKLFEIQSKYFPGINNTKNYKAPKELFKGNNSTLKEEYDKIILRNLENFAGYTKGYLEFLKEFLEKIEDGK
ncbi:MAG: hypothetical protein ACPLVD_04280 [Dictyoglomus turgidum]|uniref:Phospholipase C n=1 Tax=Dictyoglomus turgidum (strain DSM 6724 / Z-1310) TaxID=515635 RepID=B8DZT9_DICTD|nr:MULTISPECIES: hypothetical protein [Dictyoglomus]ACK42022.1 conserved hypothetical protein [Dictyoglomus turgidum DSM 6724]HBU31417.1 hypothetical protein [Dictyoglomus sp.]